MVNTYAVGPNIDLFSNNDGVCKPNRLNTDLLGFMRGLTKVLNGLQIPKDLHPLDLPAYPVRSWELLRHKGFPLDHSPDGLGRDPKKLSGFDERKMVVHPQQLPLIGVLTSPLEKNSILELEKCLRLKGTLR